MPDYPPSGPQQNLYAPQNPYGYAPPVPGPSRGLAIAALVLGIVAVLTAFIPFWSYVAIAIGIAAVVLGIVAMVKKQGGLALAGLIVGGAGLVLAVVSSIVWALLLASFSTSMAHAAVRLDDTSQSLQGDDGPRGTQNHSASTHTVELAVTGTAKDLSVDYLVGRDSDIVDGATLPWSKTFRDSSTFHLYDLDAYSDSESDGIVTCTITVDGEVVATDTESGPLAEAYCTFTGADG
jgi:hypothetical protein